MRAAVAGGRLGLRIALGILGVVLWIATASSVLRTLVVPRGSSAIVKWKNRLVVGGFRMVARRAPGYRGRDRVLLWASPICILSSLIMWLLMFFASYTLMLFSRSDLTLGASMREAGSSLFTLGFASNERNTLTALDFIAAATGPIVIGLLIGYLPTMYTAYQRRESEVTLLHARAGDPNWAPELLARHAMVANTARLDDLWPTWEEWAAHVAESHTNFPVLIHMRSARPLRSWLVSLVCVMDAAAMRLALNPDLSQGAMRVMLRQGIDCLRDLADVEQLPYDPDPQPDTPSQITLVEFVEVCEALAAVGYPIEVRPEVAYLDFRGWRANYEQIAYALAAAIDAVPAPWTGPRRPPLPVIAPQRPVNRRPDRPAD
jgi:hypothetical protein